MDIEKIEKMILELLKNKKLTTEEIENILKDKTNECSDKITFALLRLKYKNKVKNTFENKKNYWELM